MNAVQRLAATPIWKDGWPSAQCSDPGGHVFEEEFGTYLCEHCPVGVYVDEFHTWRMAVHAALNRGKFEVLMSGSYNRLDMNEC